MHAINWMRSQLHNIRRKNTLKQTPEVFPRVLTKWYERKTGEDWRELRTFNDKMQWYKLYGPLRLMGRLADKYLVREYVADKIGEEYLIPIIGVWNSPIEIDYGKLPDRFVLKATHGCGWNIIVKDKSRFDSEAASKTLMKWLNTQYFTDLYEFQYYFCEPRVIAEEYIFNTVEGKNTTDLYDYKFWCFNGKVQYIMFLEGRNTGLQMAFFNRNWERQSFVYSYPTIQEEVPKPDNLNLMISLAEKLAADFPHVRVDFYRMDDGRIYFGEMTFTSYSGICKWNPPEMNKTLGDLFDITQTTPCDDYLLIRAK